MFSPIKWTGSKRGQAKQIISYFPKFIDTYYEPFIGGGSLMLALLHSDIKINKIVCSDINQDCINYWNEIKNNPKKLIFEYKNRWNNLKNSPDRNIFYYATRERFNNYKDIYDFVFLNRTCVNGIVRYNSKGKFNAAFHFTRDGMLPSKFSKLILECSELINKHNIEFVRQDYVNINPNKNDFCYFDPPYANTKGIYFGTIDLNIFWKFLGELKCNYVLSFDGTSGEENNIYEVPKNLYTKHILTEKAISGFKKLHKKSEYVKESLYIKT